MITTFIYIVFVLFKFFYEQIDNGRTSLMIEVPCLSFTDVIQFESLFNTKQKAKRMRYILLCLL